MANATDTEHVIATFEADGTPGVSWVVDGSKLVEVLSRPFSLVLHLTTEDMDAEPSKMLGQPGKLIIERGTAMRQVTGIVSEIREGSTHEKLLSTSITVEPALEALRHSVNTKIFQEMTVPDILEQVLGEGLGAYDRSLDNRLERTYPTCEYRVQYNESDLAFCERLMEEEGIVYWFEFEDEAETMVLADSSSYGEITSIHDSSLQFSRDHAPVGGHEFVKAFHGVSQVLPTKVTTRHFDWTHPSVPIEGENEEDAAGDRPNGASLDPEREVYEHDSRPLTLHEYDGSAYGANDVEDQARLRRQAQGWDAFVCEGVSTVTGVTVGSTLELIGHPIADFDGKYLVIDVTHKFDGRARNYRNEFRCIPDGVPFRPKRLHEKPRIAGIQTAIVTGPSGEEIHTDNHGRIKVQFHWDRDGESDEHTSCWVRVMQPWAGAGWGFVFIPRIGMEVIVDFVNGDPDRPMVIGSLYNAEHTPPYALPDEKTKSTIKTETSLGGGGYNELRFEDKAGEEEIFIHAQKDHNEIVENDHTETVHHDEAITVDNNQTQDVGNDQTEHVMNNQSLEVDANRTIQVHGNYEETIDGSETRTVSSGVTETIDAGETRTITGGMKEDITGDRIQTINGDSIETINGALDQTILSGAMIMTPATYDVTAAGGFKVMAPAGSVFTALGGFTAIAPGGITTHDFQLASVGGQWFDNYAFALCIVLALNATAYSSSISANMFDYSKKNVNVAVCGVEANLFLAKYGHTNVEADIAVLNSSTDGGDVRT